jgi:hypothetical protein
MLLFLLFPDISSEFLGSVTVGHSTGVLWQDKSAINRMDPIEIDQA